MHEVKVFLQKFLARYGMFFIMIYIGAFFVFITFFGGAEAPVVWGDIRFKVFGGFVYLPFASAFMTAISVTIVLQVYKGLKS